MNHWNPGGMWIRWSQWLQRLQKGACDVACTRNGCQFSIVLCSGKSWSKCSFHTWDCLNLAVKKQEILSAVQLFLKAGWVGVSSHRLFSWQRLIRSTPGRMNLQSDIQDSSKWAQIPVSRALRVTNDSGAPGMKAVCDSPLQIIWAISLFTP